MHMWRLRNIHSKIAQMNLIISSHSNFFGYDSYHTKSKAHKLRNHFILVLRSTTKLAPPSGHLLKICSFSQLSLLKYHNDQFDHYQFARKIKFWFTVCTSEMIVSLSKWVGNEFCIWNHISYRERIVVTFRTRDSTFQY